MTSLDSATYVVPDHGFGVIHNLPIEDVSPEVFSELLESTAAEGGYLSAELGPRTAQDGFAVWIGDSLLGRLSAADSQAYALFDWVLSAGLRPREHDRCLRRRVAHAQPAPAGTAPVHPRQ